MEFSKVVKTRRSVRTYKPDPIPEDVLRRVLDCARGAPSANNIQPWHFVIVRDSAVRRELARLACDQAFVAQAPVVILCCGRRYPDRNSWIADNMYLVDCAIAIDHLTLAARSEGLGTCWIGAFDHEGVKRAVRVPSGYDVLILIPIGYPTGENAFHETRTRRAIDNIVTGL